MIKPEKYLDLDISIIRISSIILKELNKKRLINYGELLEYLIKKEGENVKEIYIYCLDFLYLLNKIKYHLKNDCIEIKNETE